MYVVLFVYVANIFVEVGDTDSGEIVMLVSDSV